MTKYPTRKKQGRQRGALLVLGLALWGSMHIASAQPAPLRDDQGQLVDIGKVPQRIVSVLPSLTETVCALDACDKLVGVDRYSNWPQPQMAKLAVVGGGIDPSVEAIVALQPDVVLMGHAPRVTQRLQALGIRTVVLEPRTQADVQRVLQVLGQLLGKPQAAEREWQRIEQGVQQAVHSLPDYVRGKKVYFEVNRGPFAAGPKSFIGELLERLGVQNIVPAHLGAFPQLNPEFVLRGQPDVLLLGSHSMLAGSMPPAWNKLTAIAHQRVCRFTDKQADIIVRPGPRMDEAARLMAACLAEKAPRHAD